MAAEMRAMAGWLHAQADRLDPMVLTSFSVPPSGILPPRWNTVLDESGDSGGIIKRKGAGVELNKPPAVSPLFREIDIMEADEEDESAELLERLNRKCCGGDCRCGDKEK